MRVTYKAFTLSEIVIVVVILGVLASFALPNYFRAIEKQKERKAVMTVQQVEIALKSWQAATSIPSFNESTVMIINNTLKTDIQLEATNTIQVTSGVNDDYAITLNMASSGKSIGTSNLNPVICCSTNNCLTVQDC